jgi:hypothetical protein
LTESDAAPEIVLSRGAKRLVIAVRSPRHGDEWFEVSVAFVSRLARGSSAIFLIATDTSSSSKGFAPSDAREFSSLGPTLDPRAREPRRCGHRLLPSRLGRSREGPGQARGANLRKHLSRPLLSLSAVRRDCRSDRGARLPIGVDGRPRRTHGRRGARRRNLQRRRLQVAIPTMDDRKATKLDIRFGGSGLSIAYPRTPSPYSSP